MSDQLDRHRSKSRRKSALGDKAIRKAGEGQMIFQPFADSPGEHDCTCAMGKREISRNRTQAHAKSVQRDGRKVILLPESRRP